MEPYILKLIQEEKVGDISFALLQLNNGNAVTFLKEGEYKDALTSYLADCSKGVIDIHSHPLPIGTPHAVVGVKIGNTIFACYSKKSTHDNTVYSGILGLLFSVQSKKQEIKEEDFPELKLYAAGIFRQKSYYLMSKSIEVMNAILN